MLAATGFADGNRAQSSDGWLELCGEETDDCAGNGELLAKVPVSQGQLVDDPDEGFAVDPKGGELRLVTYAELLELDDLFA